MVIVEVLAAAEDGVEFIDAAGEHVGLGEFVAPSAIAALNGAVHLRTSRRQEVERDDFGLAGGLELGHELASAVDLDGFHREGHVGEDLVAEVGGGLGGGAPR